MVDWINLSQSSGNSGTTVVTVSANTLDDLVQRTTSFTVRTTNTNLSKTVNIVQEPREAITLTVTPTLIEAENTGGTFRFNIVSNGDWTITYPSWVEGTVTSGSGNRTIEISIPENQLVNPRTDIISVTTRDNSVNVTVTQKRADVTLSVSPNDLVFTFSGGTSTLTITSNGEWTATTSCDWVGLSTSGGTGNGTITVTVGEHTGENKECNITITTIDGSVTVPVLQYGVVPYLEFDQHRLSYEYVGGQKVLRVNSNVEWVISDATDVDFSVTTTVSSINMRETGGTRNLGIITEGTWTATTSSNWITLSKTRGQGNTTISVTVSPSVDGTDRNGSIIISTITDSTTVSVRSASLANEYLTLEILTDGTVDRGGGYNKFSSTAYYSLNGGEWTSDSGHTSVSVVAGDVLRFKGNNTGWGSTGSLNNKFTNTTCQFKVKGNIMSLVDSENFGTITALTYNTTFNNLFYACTGLTDASELLLPATTLDGDRINGCYEGMFQGCVNLTGVPELPATSLAESCYFAMFQGCTSLTTAPELPASTLVESCYRDMFRGCTSLNYIKCLATDISAQYCTWSWVENVAENGTFVKNPLMDSWTTGVGGIPNNWQIEDNE